MNIFRHELRSYRKSTIAWVISYTFLLFVFMLIYPTFTKDIGASQKIIEGLPTAVKSALEIDLKNFFTITGFFAYLFNFIALAGGIQALNLGLSVISKEISGKTAEFLMTKPVSRTRILSEKLLAVFCLIVCTNLAFSLVAFIAAKISSPDPFSAKIFLLISSSLFLIQIFFVSLGALMANLISKIKSVISVSLPTAFAFFIISTLGAILGDDKVKYLTPFKFFDPHYIISHGNYELKFLLLEIFLVIILIGFSFRIYLKKDLRSLT